MLGHNRTIDFNYQKSITKIEMASFGECSNTAVDGYCIFSSPLHADGVKSTRSFTAGEVVYQETPMHFLQTIPNRHVVLACGCCSRFLGSVGLQMKYLEKQVNRNQLSEDVTAGDDLQVYAPLTGSIVRCSGKCGELYCSENCRETHWSKKGHKLLCTGFIPDDEAEDHPIFQFKMYAVSTNEIFLMIADIFAEVCVYCETHCDEGKTVEEVAQGFLGRYMSFVRQRWWDALQVPKGQKPIKFKKTLQKVVTECWELLSTALTLKERGLDGVLSADFLAR
jgi:hypothetical protein